MVAFTATLIVMLIEEVQRKTAKDSALEEVISMIHANNCHDLA